jgi:hypothetical protein
VTKFNRAGSQLVFSTCLGGSQGELGEGIAVDSAGAVYATGVTSSTDFPTTEGAFDPSCDLADAYVTKLNRAGRHLVYSTCLGGSRADGGNGVAVDSAASAFVTGYTNGPDFPTTPGAFDTTLNNEPGQWDAWVARLNPRGSKLVYSTYLGGKGFDRGHELAVAASGEASVTGIVYSSDFPTTPNAFDRTFNGSPDAFLTSLNATGSVLVYSSFLGGSSLAGEEGRGVALDRAGNAYVTGGTSSTDFPTTPDAFDRSCGGCPGVGDAFVTKFPLAGTR